MKRSAESQPFRSPKSSIHDAPARSLEHLL
jgi:hypothetical protein